MTLEGKKRFMINLAFIAVVLALIFFVMKYVLIWLLPFVIGLVCAFILQRPVAWLTKKTKIPRAVWSILLVIVLLSALLGLVLVLGYTLFSEVGGLVASLTKGLPSFSESFHIIGDKFSVWINRLPQQLSDALQSAPQAIAENGIGIISTSFGSVTSFILSELPNFILVSIISIVACCFITIDYNKITNFILKQFSEKNQVIIVKSKSLFMVNVIKVVLGYLLIMLITFAQLLLGLYIIDVNYAAIIALLIAFVDLLPVLGTGIILIPWGIIDIIIGKTVTGIEILVLCAIITVVRNIIEPKIIGKQVGLPSIVTLIAMYVGLNLFGIFGLWGLPILVIIIAKLQETGLVHIWKSPDPDKPEDDSDQNPDEEKTPEPQSVQTQNE